MGKGKHRAHDAQRKVVTSAIGTGVALSMTLTLVGAGFAKAESVRTVPAAGSGQSEVAQPAQWPAAESPNVHPYEGLEIPHDTLSSLQWARPMPEKNYLAPVGVLHPPVPVAPVPPIAPPAGKLRFGDVQVDAPQWLYREQAIQVNDGAAVAEADMATFLDSVGMERSRSDRIAGETLGGAAIGAAAGAAVASPFALIGAVVGGGIGLAVGVPFAPIGLAAGPIGAAYGAALMAVPLTAIGAAAGGTLGAVHALTAPPRTVEDR
ncbi:hypothetical protein FHY52_02250 [Nocardia nova]|jgi:hypothetical protein|uniref:hypothetical protein n=2 Tax=Nocardiaceae TaxID=85025 RepID=UPI0009DF89ED|nr:hypothetical protein [Nocardia nova]MBF6148628.1 hypothetical protein [Nocardia nova]MDN2495537.1 hypothetical protein [Nocardia nova]